MLCNQCVVKLASGFDLGALLVGRGAEFFRTSFRIVPSSTPNSFAAGSKVANSTYSWGIFS
jgi:hypothetical protein